MRSHTHNSFSNLWLIFLKFHEHARTKRINSPSQAEVKKPLYRTAVGRWRNYEKYLEPYMSGLEPFLKELNYR
jgi:hypothetical protein